jgi:hypothetical protein
MERIKYTCANCGWETSVIAQWKDLKPKRCMNKKCNASFLKNPEALLCKDPTIKSEVVKKPQKEEKYEKAVHKHKKFSKADEQQTEE